MKHMNKRLATYLLLLIGCSTLYKTVRAQDTPTLTLDTILRRIDQQNVQLKAYLLRKESYQYKAQASTAWMAPMVGAGTFMTPYPGQQVMDPSDKGSLMVNIEQAIPNPAKQKATKQYIASQGLQEESQRQVHLNELKSQAKGVYYAWIVAKKRIVLLQENEQLLKTMKQLEQIRYEYNQSSLSNAFKADAKLAENTNMIQMQEAIMTRNRAYLNSLMNLSGNPVFDIDTLSLPRFSFASLDTSRLATQRQDIQTMDRKIQSMRYGIAAVHSERNPDFKIRFDHMSPLGGMMPTAYSVMGMVSIPIVPWSSKMYKNEQKAMQLDIEAMEEERSGMLIESQGMLFGMQEEIKKMQERLDRMKEKVIPALKAAMEATFQTYRENKQQLPAVLTDWETLNMMRNTVLDDQLQLYLMITNYEKELYL